MNGIQRLRAGRGPAVMLGLLIASCATPASLAPSPSAAPTPSATPAPTGSSAAAPTPEATPPLDEALLHERLTVLVLGQDSSTARRAAGFNDPRTDAIMVVSISADQSQLVQISLPRDTVDIPLPGGGVWRGKVNQIPTVLGLPTMRDAVALLLGIQIDAYVQVDMDGFDELVDAVRGVTLEIPEPIIDRKIHLAVDAGWQHLSGAEALAYVRTRVDSDYARAARQQLILRVLAAKYAAPETVFDLPSLLDALDSLRTDLDLADIPTLREIGRRAVSATVTAAVLGPPRFARFTGIEPGTNRGWIMIPDVDAMRAYVAELMSD